MSEIVLTTSSFDEGIKSISGKVLVDFWAPWCGPCRMIAENLEDAVSETSGVTLAKVNVDDNPELADRYQINAIPALLVFKDCKLVNRGVGYMNKEQIKNLLK